MPAIAAEPLIEHDSGKLASLAGAGPVAEEIPATVCRTRAVGRRLEPEAADHLPWEELEGVDAVYFTAGDDGALRHARQAKVLVATSRAMKRLAESDVELDAIVGSARDPAERYDSSGLSTLPRLVVMTEGREGGRFETADGRSGTYETPPPPGPVVDTYGAERVMCGSDYPYPLGERPAGDIVRTADFLDHDQRDAVLGANAERFLSPPLYR